MLESLRVSNIPQPNGYAVKTYQENNLQYGVAPIDEYVQIILRNITASVVYSYTIPTDLQLINFQAYQQTPASCNVGFTNLIEGNTILSLNVLSTVSTAFGNTIVYTLPSIILKENSRLNVTVSANVTYLQVNLKKCKLTDILLINP